MTQETQAQEHQTNTIYVPRIELYGPGDLRGIRPFSYQGNIGTEITNRNERFCDIHDGAITLRDNAFLFNLYLKSELGEAPDTPAELRGLLFYLFNQKGRGNFTNDVLDYNMGDKSVKKVKDTDSRVLWLRAPEIEKITNGYIARPGKNPDSDEIPTIVPESGFVELTLDGAYHPVTGAALSTVPERETAEKSYTDRGFSPEFARKAISYWFSRKEGEGQASVDRGFFDDGGGRFYVGAVCRLDGRGPDVGRLASSRSPSGARQDSGEGMFVSNRKYAAIEGLVGRLQSELDSLKQ